jgi:hypothetical protein
MARKKTRPSARKAASKPQPLGVRAGAKMSVAKKRALTKLIAAKVTLKKGAPKKGLAKKWVTSRKAASKRVAKSAATYILSAPKGARVLTHREIKRAVERVFEERYGTDA